MFFSCLNQFRLLRIFCRSISNAGFLRLRDEESFLFAVPNAGIFLKELSKGRLDVLRILSRRQFHDIPEEVGCPTKARAL